MGLKVTWERKAKPEYVAPVFPTLEDRLKEQFWWGFGVGALIMTVAGGVAYEIWDSYYLWYKYIPWS